MGIRNFLEQRPIVSLSACAIAVLAAFYFARGTQHPTEGRYTRPGLYYSSDDGKTFVAKPAVLVPPFDEDGQVWVRAVVFKSADSGPYIAYLEKFTDEARDDITNNYSTNVMRSNRMLELGDRALLVKRPGDPQWIPKDAANPDSVAITHVTNPATGEPANPITPLDWTTGK